MKTMDAANNGGGAGTNGPPTKPTKRWLSTREVSELSGRHQETVLLALRRGLLAGVQPGKNASWRVRVEDYEAWAALGAPLRKAA